MYGVHGIQKTYILGVNHQLLQRQTSSCKGWWVRAWFILVLASSTYFHKESCARAACWPALASSHTARHRLTDVRRAAWTRSVGSLTCPGTIDIEHYCQNDLVNCYLFIVFSIAYLFMSYLKKAPLLTKGSTCDKVKYNWEKKIINSRICGQFVVTIRFGSLSLRYVSQPAMLHSYPILRAT